MQHLRGIGIKGAYKLVARTRSLTKVRSSQRCHAFVVDPY